MSVLNGQLANQTTFNNAFMSRTAANTSTVAIVSLENGAMASGAIVTNAQQAINETFDAVGMTGINDATRNDYSSNEVISNGDDRKEAIGKIDAEFNDTTGHNHDGSPGRGGQVSAISLANFNRYWAVYQSFAKSGVSGLSVDISTELTGKSPGGAASNPGVITAAPQNLAHIVDSSTQTFIEDAGGQRVYARITESSGVWTLTFYTNEAGVETAHNLASTDIRVIYWEVFDQALRPTIPSNPFEFGTLDVTADVVDASASVAGKVSISAQTFAGLKTFDDGIAYVAYSDATATGSDAVVALGASKWVRLTDGGLISVAKLSSPADGEIRVLSNNTGTTISIVNDAGDSASILTGTGANLEVPNDGTIILIYDTIDNRWKVIGGSGSGGGLGINHIDNADATTGVVGWATYADAAGTKPVNGIGGSPTITLTQSMSNPLRGTASFLITKDAADRQGEGVSVDFTIDRADRAQVQKISFDYEVSDDYVTGDMRVYVLDVTNNVLYEALKRDIEAVSPNGTYESYVQVGPSSTSYRLIFHIATTNANAYTVKLDTVICGPTYGGAQGDKVIAARVFLSGVLGFSDGVATQISYDNVSFDTHAGYSSGVYTVPEEGFYALKASLETDSYAWAAGNLVQIYKYINGSYAGVLDEHRFQTSVTQNAHVEGDDLVYLYKGDTVEFYGFVQRTGGANSNADGNYNFATINRIGGSSVNHDNRVIAAKANDTGGFTVTSTPSVIIFGTEDFDTDGAYDPVTGTFTAPRAGKYDIHCNVASSSVLAVAFAWYIEVVKNNSTVEASNIKAGTGASNTFNALSVSTTVDLEKGDTINIYTKVDSGTLSLVGSGGYNTLSIHNVTGPTSNQPADEVHAKVYVGSVQTIADVTITTVNMDTVVYDTHNAWDTTNKYYVAPIAGYYNFSGSLAYDVNASGIRNVIYKKNSGSGIDVANMQGTSSGGYSNYINFTFSEKLEKGDTIEILTYQSSGGNLNIVAGSPNLTRVTVDKW